MRLPFRERLTLLVNEFGTALAGNSDNLNKAIRRGAPALEQTRKVFDLLASQNTIIRDLNSDSEAIISKLADRRQDVVDFIDEAGNTAKIAASRRDDLSQNFALLDDFLAELRPTMTELNSVAVQGTPLATNLRLAAPGLTELSRRLPDFNPAATDALVSLGKTSVVGKRALDKGNDEIKILAKSSKKSFSVADQLSNFLRDIDDPNRAVEADSRANTDTGRKGETGYTGMEGLLNYVYYQTGAVNQFDEIGHLLHFSIFEVGTGPCANYNPGHYDPDGPGPEEPQLGVPDASGDGVTTNILEANRCVAWLGANQPGINQSVDVPPYDPSVCPDGSTVLSLCDPNGPTSNSFGKGDDSGKPSFGDAGDSGQGGSGGGSGDGSGDRLRSSSGSDPGGDVPPGSTPPAGSPTRRHPRDRGTRPRGHPRPDHRRPSHRCRRGQRRPPRIPVRNLMRARLDTRDDREELGEQPPLTLRHDRVLADDGRRDHHADRDRRRLPRLQRQQRAPVRARLPRLGGRPQRIPARPEQRGADRRRRVGVVESISSPRSDPPPRIPRHRAAAARPAGSRRC